MRIEDDFAKDMDALAHTLRSVADQVERIKEQYCLGLTGMLQAAFRDGGRAVLEQGISGPCE